MGIDLVSACVFCAGMLLGTELSPRPGLGGELGFSYATLARRWEIGVTVDTSDVTPKFVLVGMGYARFPAPGLGAGTPEFEWRARAAFGTSHDEQARPRDQPDLGLPIVLSNGTGRAENFALLARLPVSPADSIEVAGEGRNNRSTDVINFGGTNQELSEARDLSSQRIDASAGWRHRWRGLEAMAAFRWTKLTGYNATARSFYDASGSIFGGEAELRYRPAPPWTLVLHAEYESGNLDVHRESYPHFVDRDTEERATLQAYRLTAGYCWSQSELMLSSTYDRQELPFVSLAVLGREVETFDQGFDPFSDNEEFFFDLVYRYTFSPAIRARLGARLAWGDETVTLTDSAGILPTQTLDVLRRGIFGGSLSDPLGSPEFTFFIGADFSIGAPQP
jgi:hypothetical protein